MCHVRVVGHTARVLKAHAQLCEEVACEGVKVGDLEGFAVEHELLADVEVLHCVEGVVAGRWAGNAMAPNDCA